MQKYLKTIILGMFLTAFFLSGFTPLEARNKKTVALTNGKHKRCKNKKNENQTFFVQAETADQILVLNDNVPEHIPLKNMIGNDFQLTENGDLQATRNGSAIIHFATQVISSSPANFPVSGSGAVRQFFYMNGTPVSFTNRQHIFSGANQMAIMHSHTFISFKEGDVFSFFVSGNSNFGISPIPASDVEPGGSSATVSIESSNMLGPDCRFCNINFELCTKTCEVKYLTCKLQCPFGDARCFDLCERLRNVCDDICGREKDFCERFCSQ